MRREIVDKVVLIKGAGDIASGIALRLHHCGFKIVMTDLPMPTAVRRTVAFSEAIRLGSCSVEDCEAVRVDEPFEMTSIFQVLGEGKIAVLPDPEVKCMEEVMPDIVVDSILAKRNLGTRITDAKIVVGIGPGFTAGVDCHAVIETKRGHALGRVILDGSAIPNTGIPGNIGGYTSDRVIRPTMPGRFFSDKRIGDLVKAGDIVAYVRQENGQTEWIPAQISGMIRGLLQDGITVHKGMKCGDIDPRGESAQYLTVSDKALAIAGGVLEAILRLSQ